MRLFASTFYTLFTELNTALIWSCFLGPDFILTSSEDDALLVLPSRGCSIPRLIVMMKHIRALCSELVPASLCPLLCRPSPPTFIFLRTAVVSCSVTGWKYRQNCSRKTGLFFAFLAWKCLIHVPGSLYLKRLTMIVSRARLLLHAHAEAFLHPSVFCKLTLALSLYPSLGSAIVGSPAGQVLAHDVAGVGT